jgi:alkanesulfonate monooxygenase SsuD/methylene tetrahydromethanopterin reductase-like flavin-dependent oxidoreductase (luciferase family)
METGVAIFPTHDAFAPADMARLAEERGHESLFCPEHTHIPAGRQTPSPGGGELPRRYAHTFDLFVAVTAAVTATSRLRVGSGICLVIGRDPITTAKEVASVDFLSGGRVEAMKEIWTNDEASYAGEYVSFERIWSWPKPAKRPHPPVLVGGNGPGVPADAKVLEAYAEAGFQRAVHWLPSAARGPVERALDRCEAAIAEFHGE